MNREGEDEDLISLEDLVQHGRSGPFNRSLRVLDLPSCVRQRAITVNGDHLQSENIAFDYDSYSRIAGIQIGFPEELKDMNWSPLKGYMWDLGVFLPMASFQEVNQKLRAQRQINFSIDRNELQIAFDCGFAQFIETKGASSIRTVVAYLR